MPYLSSSAFRTSPILTNVVQLLINNVFRAGRLTLAAENIVVDSQYRTAVFMLIILIADIVSSTNSPTVFISSSVRLCKTAIALGLT